MVRVARDRGEGVTIEQVAKDFGVHPMTLHKWMRRADIDEGRSPGVSATESAELREARKRILDTGDLATLGLGAPLPLGGGSSHATPAATGTPSAPASPAPSTTGLSASATANAQPVTSGTSAQGLHTSTDVTGRSGEPRGAFSVGPETKTSGATGTGTSGTAPASATGT